MRQLSKKQKVTTAVVTLLALSGTGTLAYAYWTEGGSGTGTADTGDTVALVILQSASVTGLVPGIVQGLDGTIRNDNTFPVRVNSISVAVDPAWSAGVTDPCDAGDFTLVQPTTANVDAAVDDSTTWTGASITLINKAGENQDNCKNVTVPLVYTSN